ncbi:hypothetical protein J1614_004574 [Plenodomus biglobosus]|nr:hypothetical protein J1614_004574 [Plenodomus biglobosus]
MPTSPIAHGKTYGLVCSLAEALRPLACSPMAKQVQQMQVGLPEQVEVVGAIGLGSCIVP